MAINKSILLIPLIISISGFKLIQSGAFMPHEYKRIKTAVDRLARNNNLGNRKIVFTITPGSEGYYLAQQMHLCEKDECNTFGRIDPFKRYKDDQLNELNRQSYLWGLSNAFASPNGTISIARTSFKVSDNLGYLACQLAHEIAHVKLNHQFEHSYKLAQIKTKGADEIKMIRYQLRRQDELEADREGARMVIRAGFPSDTCIRSFNFSARSRGHYHEDKPDSTHPGHTVRVTHLADFIEKNQKQIAVEKRRKRTHRWSYSRQLNALTFSPDVN